MRPHDIVILLKIAANKGSKWLMKDLAHELGISASEVTESLSRSVAAGLLAENKKRLMKTALLDFLAYGLQRVYPQKPGRLVRGLPTAHSAPPLKQKIEANEIYVWPYSEGNIRGQEILPLHPNVPEACTKDEDLYELLALADAIRVGKARERRMAINALKKRI